MPKKRIVLLTREGAEHCYVANTLAAAIPLHSIIVDRSAPRANIRRALRIGKLHFLMKAARSVFLMAIGDARSRKRTLKAFFAGKGDAIAALDKIIPVEGINSLASQDRLREMKPDVILVYGTSLVKQLVLDFARDFASTCTRGSARTIGERPARSGLLLMASSTWSGRQFTSALPRSTGA
jgi:hypothetical protein